ncbi:MAG: hypothetical protein EYC70_00365 [Planctomycetota bacterium]|nr:MAG: hypothetical protein EYC70_00365 [Planctomycetota bacterium]
MRSLSFLFPLLAIFPILTATAPHGYAASPQGPQGTSIWIGEPSSSGEFKVEFRFQNRNRFDNEVTFARRSVTIQVTKGTSAKAKAAAFQAALDTQLATLPESVRTMIDAGRTGTNITTQVGGSDLTILSDIEADVVSDGTDQDAKVYNRPDPVNVTGPGLPSQLGVAPYDIGVRFTVQGLPSGVPSKGGPQAYVKFGVDAFGHTVYYGPGQSADQIAHELAEAFRGDAFYVFEDGPSFLIVFPNGVPFADFASDDSDAAISIGWQIVSTR